MGVPRSMQEILDHADELAAQFEAYQPGPSDAREGGGLTAVRDAVLARSDAERALALAVQRARDEGHSWRSIGRILGTSGEAARQRYGRSHDAKAVGSRTQSA